MRWLRSAHFPPAFWNLPSGTPTLSRSSRLKYSNDCSPHFSKCRPMHGRLQLPLRPVYCQAAPSARSPRLLRPQLKKIRHGQQLRFMLSQAPILGPPVRMLKTALHKHHYRRRPSPPHRRLRHTHRRLRPLTSSPPPSPFPPHPPKSPWRSRTTYAPPLEQAASPTCRPRPTGALPPLHRAPA